jgi:hypothetical protein
MNGLCYLIRGRRHLIRGRAAPAKAARNWPRTKRAWIPISGAWRALQPPSSLSYLQHTSLRLLASGAADGHLARVPEPHHRAKAAAHPDPRCARRRETTFAVGAPDPVFLLTDPRGTTFVQIEALGRSPSPRVRQGQIGHRSVVWRLDQAPVPVGHLQHRRSHPVPFVRHHAQPASPGEWRWHGHHHLVRRDRERYDLVDHRRDMATGTPRAVSGRHLAAQQHRGEHEHQRCVRHLPPGWGFSTNQDFNGDIVLILCCGACWTGHMVRRWHADPFGFLRPWNEVPALMGSAPPATPPSTGTGVVTFLMG